MQSAFRFFPKGHNVTSNPSTLLSSQIRPTTSFFCFLNGHTSCLIPPILLPVMASSLLSHARRKLPIAPYQKISFLSLTSPLLCPARPDLLRHRPDVLEGLPPLRLRQQLPLLLGRHQAARDGRLLPPLPLSQVPLRPRARARR